jgi:hypothetical protein
MRVNIHRGFNIGMTEPELDIFDRSTGCKQQTGFKTNQNKENRHEMYGASEVILQGEKEIINVSDEPPKSKKKCWMH